MQVQSKRDINLYLFYEFGIEGDEAQVSDDWPFELHKVGRVSVGSHESQVFEFSDSEQTYFALDVGGLNFYPSEDMTIEQLQLQEQGRFWLGQREPIDLNTVRIGDDSVPRTPHRRSAIEEMAASALQITRSNIRILEGLFLKKDQTYLALVEKVDSGEVYALGSNLEPYRVNLPGGSDWRRLSLAVGYALQAGTLHS
jgi:hypothetical protein